MAQRILIVDDDPVLIKLLYERLTKNGYDILTASDPVLGLQMAMDYEPDLIILDVLMPVMNGYTFFLKLKNNQHTSHIPVIVLTIRGQMKDSFMAIGANSFMSKPFNVEELLAKIRSLLSDLGNVDVQKLEKEFKQETQSVMSVSQRSGANYRFLVAGADETVVAFIKQELTRLTYDVQTAQHGLDILEAAIQHNPNFILMEVQMEEESVYEIVDKLKQIHGLQALILLYTVFKDKESAKNSILHKLLSVQPSKEDSKLAKQSFQYFGVFDRDTFTNKIEKLLK